MVKVIILKSLIKEIEKKFKGESLKVISLIETLRESPHKGKHIGQVGGLTIKELKYKSFRFYFILDGNELKLYSQNELIDILILFTRMSDKNNQQKIINEIKSILKEFGKEGFGN
ncbi:MAG: hypothetical protein ACI83O_000259 [Patescibacteria group bacterium]|jgi:hypothetical protein